MKSDIDPDPMRPMRLIKSTRPMPSASGEKWPDHLRLPSRDVELAAQSPNLGLSVLFFSSSAGAGNLIQADGRIALGGEELRFAGNGFN